MKIYQLKIKITHDQEMVIATFKNEDDSYDALADWSENYKQIRKKFDEMSDEEMDKHYLDILGKLPEMYQSYGDNAWIEEHEILDEFKPEILDVDLNVMNF